MKKIKEYFSRLGLREDASWEEIETAFNKKMIDLRKRTFDDDPKGRKKDKERRLLIRAYYALQEYETNGRVMKRGLKKPSNKEALLLLCVGICVLFLTMSCERTFDEAVDQEAARFVNLSSCANAAQSDLQIAEIAKKSAETLEDSGTPWTTYTGGRHYTEPEEMILEEADCFAQCYWNMESFADVEQYLRDTYEDFRKQYDNADDFYEYVDEEAAEEAPDLRLRVDMVCAFYGFYTKDQAYGKKDPYTKKGIGMYHTYLQYLQMYKETV